MNISTPVSLPILAHFKSGVDAITHFTTHVDGSVTCFGSAPCEECGALLQSANSITFIPAAVRNRLDVFLEAGLLQSDASADYALDGEGQMLCLDCAAKAHA